ncbi:MAG: hypothetical protein ACE5LS_07005 [Thermoplasmata archaeon]
MKFSESFLLVLLLGLSAASFGLGEAEGGTIPTLSADAIPLSTVRPGDLGMPPPQPAATITIPIHIIFMGVPQSLIEDPTIYSTVLPSYEPSAVAPALAGQVNRYATYSFAYDITLVPDSTANAYTSWLLQNLRMETAPFWIQQLADYPVGNVGKVDAISALGWLESNLASTLSSGYSIVIIDTLHTTPSMPYYYFYEYQPLDIDTGLPFPGYSRYMTGFGGGTGRMLFIDLDSGPTNVDMFGYGIHVNRTTMPPIWDYSPLYDHTRFSTDVANYVNFAIMQLFTPSFLFDPSFSPGYHLQVTIFNDDSTRSYLPFFDLQAAVNAFADVQPLSTWSGSVREVALSSDPALALIVSGATDPQTGSIESEALIGYFLANYDAYVPPQGTDFVIPAFLFAFPERRLFDGSAGGMVVPDQAEPRFILAVTSPELLGLEPALYFGGGPNVIYSGVWASDTFGLDPGYYTFFSGGARGAANAAVVGWGNEAWLNITFDVGSGSVDFFLVTEYEYVNWTQGGGDPLVFGSGLSGPGWFADVPMSAPGYYYAIFYNSGSTAASVTIQATTEQFLGGSGFTYLVVHEGAHFLGLAHPHDGLLWPGSSNFVNWFYDFTISPLSYLVSTTTFGQFDKDTLLRGNVLTFMGDALGELFAGQLVMMAEDVRYVPWNVMDAYNETLGLVLAAKSQLEANRYTDAFLAGALARLAAANATEVLLADLASAPLMEVVSNDSDGILAGGNEVLFSGRVHDVYSFALEYVLDDQRFPVPYEPDGRFSFLLQNLSEGRHTVLVEATDAKGRVLSESFTLQVTSSSLPVATDLLVLFASLAAAGSASVIGAFMFLRRYRAIHGPPPPMKSSKEPSPSTPRPTDPPEELEPPVQEASDDPPPLAPPPQP